MRLAEFLSQDMESILSDFESFAATVLPASDDMVPGELRGRAHEVLQTVLSDLRTPQTRTEQHDKSLGHGSGIVNTDVESTAQRHGTLRARAGMTINQIAAEYRALRASVLRRWLDVCQPEAPDLDDLIRFNEAIDHALAGSVIAFNAQIEQNRDLLLGMLGHDMRNPLQAIQVTASYLAALNAGEPVAQAAGRLIRSGSRIRALLDDLTEFNRTNLGLGIGVSPTRLDLATVLAEELDELRAVYPSRQIDASFDANLMGVWDGPRLQQLLGNLVLNALKYGAQNAPVQIVVRADATLVRIEVRNQGPAIDCAMLARIFDPLARGVNLPSGVDKAGSLGLGLYIASEIAKAHQGAIEARSDETATTFSVVLPRPSVP